MFKIQHIMNGRVRFKVPAIRMNANASRRYEAHFEEMEGIRWVGGNTKSASLIIRYDPRTISSDDVIARMQQFTGSGTAPPVVDKARSRSAAPGDLSLKIALGRFLGLTFLVGLVFIREVVLKRPLAQKLFSPFGIITTVAALPLLKNGVKKLNEGRVTLESFLGGSIIAAVVAGEVTAALEILWITSGGEVLQNWVTERSRSAIQDILTITEKDTYILRDGVEVSVPVDQLEPGDTVVLHTGEKIAVDGEIIKGEAVIDEAPITGRSEPIARKKGEKVFAGTYLRQGVIFVRAKQVGDRTYLARILLMVEDSLENKAPIEGMADRLAHNLIKAGFAMTIATFILTRSVWRAFSVMLVMACPCATILAASTAVSAALNAAASRHILIKGGRYLEEIGRANIICFDKTGTLTTSEPELKQFMSFNGYPRNELLQLAYSTEIHNSHPVALAIKKEAGKRDIRPIQHEVCEYFLGKGVRSEIHGDEILVGSHKLMEAFSVAPEKVRSHLERLKKQGLTLIFIAKNRELLGLAGFANQDRADVAEVVRYLRNDRVDKTAMVTGDSKYSALEMAHRLGFDDCRYSVLPEEKADIVAALRTNGDSVLMVGDGINDALALAEADIGVAMGTGGSEVAVEAADIALVRDDLKDLVYVRGLSRETIRIIHQNFWIATGSNVVGVVLGALGLLSPVMAGLVHITHTIGILANSSRMLIYDAPPIISEDTEHTENKTNSQQSG